LFLFSPSWVQHTHTHILTLTQAARGSKAKETLPGHFDEVYALDWAPNGSSVASGSKDRTIKIWKS